MTHTVIMQGIKNTVVIVLDLGLISDPPDKNFSPMNMHIIWKRGVHAQRRYSLHDYILIFIEKKSRLVLLTGLWTC